MKLRNMEARETWNMKKIKRMDKLICCGRLTYSYFVRVCIFRATYAYDGYDIRYMRSHCLLYVQRTLDNNNKKIKNRTNKSRGKKTK